MAGNTPPNWARRPVRTALTVGGSAAFGLLCGGWAARCFVQGDPLTGLTTLGFAAFFFGLSLQHARGALFRNVTPRGTVERASRVVLRPDRIGDGTLRAGMLLGAGGGLLFVILAPAGDLDISLTAGQRTFLPIGVGAVLLMIGYTEVHRRRNGEPRVEMSPHGVVLVDSWSCSDFPWGEMVRIDDRTRSGTSQNGHPIVIATSDRTHVFNDALSYTPGGAALYWMLRHYWLHPDHRDELTDGRALRRYLAGDFPVE
ncbi:hypothetical protein GCM10009624_14180 [Gordonia sinesedis]